MQIHGQANDKRTMPSALTCELEDWFHILDSDKVPPLEAWDNLPLRAERSIDKLLQLFEDNHVHATFFCLGWMAERMPHVVRECQAAGHEIGSHGYGHLMARRENRIAVWEDITRAKHILEDIVGTEVVGFRSPGFSVKNDNPWFFDTVARAGYRYDASVFPAYHGHGGYHGICPVPHVIETTHGPLVEIPVSTVRLLGQRVCLFGGGYLRLSPLPLLRWGVHSLRTENRPLIVYVHPREIDPDHPRLPLGPCRRFKCYVNLSTTWPKMTWLCKHHQFGTMAELASRVTSRFRHAAELPGRIRGTEAAVS